MLADFLKAFQFTKGGEEAFIAGGLKAHEGSGGWRGKGIGQEGEGRVGFGGVGA